MEGRPNTEVWSSPLSVASETEAASSRWLLAHLLVEEPLKSLVFVSALSRTALSDCWKLLLRQCPLQWPLGGPAFLEAGLVPALVWAG